jgi:hypothetical protein
VGAPNLIPSLPSSPIRDDLLRRSLGFFAAWSGRLLVHRSRQRGVLGRIARKATDPHLLVLVIAASLNASCRPTLVGHIFGKGESESPTPGYGKNPEKLAVPPLWRRPSARARLTYRMKYRRALAKFSIFRAKDNVFRTFSCATLMPCAEQKRLDVQGVDEPLKPQDGNTPTGRAMTRRLRRTARSRRRRERFSSETDPWRGAETKRQPHERQREVRVPAKLRPMWTTCYRGTAWTRRAGVRRVHSVSIQSCRPDGQCAGAANGLASARTSAPRCTHVTLDP